jgi:hypothetical protein
MGDLDRPSRMSRRFRLAAAGILLAMIGCVSAIPVPDGRALEAARARDPEISLQALADDRATYIRKCSGCHSLHIPSEYTDDEWILQMDKMASEAFLSTEEEDSILRYLLAVNDR